MILYGYWRSSATWRVRIGLGLKGIAYETRFVHLAKGEQLGAEHAARSPMRQIPVLELPSGERLTQSVAILEWLEEAHPAPALLPGDALGRARVRELVEIVNSGVQPLQNLSVLKAVEELGGDRTGWAAAANAKGLDALEALAAGSAGRFLHGDHPTLADCCLIPQLYSARRFGLDVARWPTLARVEANCAAMPAFQAAHADHQPDATP